MKKIMRHWKTSALGVCAIVGGSWSMDVTYVSTNTLYFNVCYVWPGAIALLIVGVALLLAADADKA
jgi:hypothetical protein